MDPEHRAHAEEMDALEAFMAGRASDTIKAAEAMTPEELAEDVAFLQDVRRKLGEVERDLTIALGKKMGKGTGSLADGRMFTVARSSDRKEWNHDDWKRDVRRQIVNGMGTRNRLVLVDVTTGEDSPQSVEELLYDAIAQAQEVHGAQAPKSKALKALDLFASDYCTSIPSGWRFTAVAPHDTTTEKETQDDA
jgi:hypothetical protein